MFISIMSIKQILPQLNYQTGRLEEMFNHKPNRVENTWQHTVIHAELHEMDREVEKGDRMTATWQGKSEEQGALIVEIVGRM